MINNDTIILGSGYSAALCDIFIPGNKLCIGLKNNNIFYNSNFNNCKIYRRNKEFEINKLSLIRSKSFGVLQSKLYNAKLHDKLCFGGKSKIWGGFINSENISEENIKVLNTNNIFLKKLNFLTTGSISNIPSICQMQDKENHIFSAQNYFKNIIDNYVHKIVISKSNIKLVFFDGNFVETNKVFLATGVLQTLDLLYRSGFIANNDTIQLTEFKYNISLKFKTDPLNFDTEDTVIRIKTTRALNHLLSIQKKYSLYDILPIYVDQVFSKVKEELKLRIINGSLTNISINKLPFGKSIHYCNLHINGIDAQTYIRKISKNITGVGMSFVDQCNPGPISNDILRHIINLKN